MKKPNSVTARPVRAVSLKAMSAADVLDMLSKTYTFGPAMDKALAEYTTRDPLLDPPRFISRANLQEVREGDVFIVIYLGEVHGFRTSLTYNRTRSTTVLKCGCQHIRTEQEARRHWYKNVSISSYEERPYATALIDWVAAICRFRGWPW